MNYFNKTDEYNIISNLLKRKNVNEPVIIDGGAHYGQSIKKFKKYFPKSKIYSFEPIPKLAHKLKETFLDVEIFNLALGKKYEISKFNINKDSSTSSIFEPGLAKQYYKSLTTLSELTDIKIDSLDNLKNSGKIKQPQIIKLDLQGYELEALRGSIDTLKETYIVHTEIEFVELYKNQALFRDVEKFLSENNFQLFNLYDLVNSNNGQLLYANSIFVNKYYYKETSSDNDISNKSFYSQFGQDELIYNTFFKDKKNGFFVDIGASDGVEISNSYFFEKELSWNGICIEPRASAFEKLKRNRRCICENVAISDQSGTSVFFEYFGKDGVYSGLKSKYDSRYEKTMQPYMSSSVNTKKEIEVKTLNFAELCKKYKIEHIDYINIDTEGGELDIIKSLNNYKIEIDCITIENNFDDIKIKEYLKSKRFIFFVKKGCDDIYISRNLYKKNKKGVVVEKLKYQYYKLIPINIRILLNKSGISRIIKSIIYYKI